MLRALDLFSGIGGFSIGMRGLVTPVAYCEMDPDAQCVLRSQMSAGNIERAPIFPDVTALRAQDVGVFDIVMGGWPCQDNSPRGLRRGANGARSGLLKHVLRLAREGEAPFMFLENVPASLKSGLQPILEDLVDSSGYDIAWCTVPASAVGAPHVRKRLFLLASKRGSTHEWPVLEPYAPFSWHPSTEPARTVPLREGYTTRWKRIAMTGNAVVPDCVRMAFVTLASGFTVVPGPRSMNVARLKIGSSAPPALGVSAKSAKSAKAAKAAATLPPWGYMSKTLGPGRSETVTAVTAVTPPQMLKPMLDLTFDPHAYKGERRQTLPMGVVASPTLTESKRATSWATPRIISSAGHVLTKRMAGDLPTQVRFETSTPEDGRGGKISPAFVEWMMGFSRDWTALPHAHRVSEPIGYRQHAASRKAALPTV
jgi:site-specific DNA-cytosine methylase